MKLDELSSLHRHALRFLWSPGFEGVRRFFKHLELRPGYDMWEESARADADAPTVPANEANVAISLSEDGSHYPVIDLDIPAMLVPSTTEGHSHLYINYPLSQEDYWKVLDVLTEVGIVEEGFTNASKLRGFSVVRLPWVSKEEDDELILESTMEVANEDFLASLEEVGGMAESLSRGMAQVAEASALTANAIPRGWLSRVFR